MKRTLLFLALVFSAILPGYAQPSFDNYVSAGLGYSIIAEQLPEGFPYKPLTILPSISIWHKGHFSVYAEAQFTQAVSALGFQTEYELGANLGVRYLLSITPQLTLTAAIASGPNYITIETSRQASGFIFSDNFELGLSYFLKSIGTTVQIRPRFRHISNAGLQSPNGGIDNLFLVIGVEKQW